MKKLIKLSSYLLVAVLSVTIFASCEKDNDIDISEKEEALSAAVKQYVDKTVIVTYKNLADATIDLYADIKVLRENKTDANLKIATDQWIKTREYWELSEAFLFGAVADFGIDPHIDTWPLDETRFLQLINNQQSIANMDTEDGDIWVVDYLGFALLGFHGIEYIMFKDGNVKSASEITENQLIYALAVMGDLRNQCIRLEAAWVGYDAVTEGKQALIDEKELVIIPSNSEIPYGENMLAAGKAGSTYKSITSAALAILDGCTVISEEVGDIKIGNPYRGDDVNYLESPYSYNSLEDFENNIISIENAYLGGADANNRGKSVSDYVKSVDPDADTNVKNAIQNAIDKIQAIPFPFEKNYSTPQAGEAINACTELTTALNKAKEVVISGN